MTKKIIGAGLVIAILVVIVLFVSRQENPPQKAEVPSAVAKDTPNQTSPVPAAKKAVSTPVPTFENAAYQTNSVEETISKLQEISTGGDSKSFQLIVSALTNANREIREAAVEAATQFGSRDAIPFLKEAAAKTDDAREKVTILDAVEFLELPSFDEIKTLRRTNSSPQKRSL